METTKAEQAIEQVEESDAAIDTRNRRILERILAFGMQTVLFGWRMATKRTEPKPSLLEELRHYFPGVELTITDETSGRALRGLWEKAELEGAGR